ncbi:MAG: 16S rRNA (guanine(966)-N(2))-methyltransferase RsmD, partial [Nitrospinota bacterium]
MRVISGSCKGRRLIPPVGTDIRPTPDKVKGALFNIIGECVIGSSFLDLFAGTGAVGIEALSRGAREVVFVDKSIRAIETVKGNLRVCNLEKDSMIQGVRGASKNPQTHEPSKPKILILKGDAVEIIKKFKTGQFDFIFLDPPYKSDLGEKALKEISRYNILKEGGEAILEHYYKNIPDPSSGWVGELKLRRTIRYGDTALSFFC